MVSKMLEHTDCEILAEGETVSLQLREAIILGWDFSVVWLLWWFTPVNNRYPCSISCPGRFIGILKMNTDGIILCIVVGGLSWGSRGRRESTQQLSTGEMNILIWQELLSLYISFSFYLLGVIELSPIQLLIPGIFYLSITQNALA